MKFQLRIQILKKARRIRHRGPDWSGLYMQEFGDYISILTHERLAIVDPISGAQPLFSHDKTLCMSINGEIYNHNALKNIPELKNTLFVTKSDCEVVVHLIDKLGVKAVNMLDGVFAWAISDAKTQKGLVARDSIGVIPLYWGHAGDGSIWVSSELKAIQKDCVSFREFPPGCFMTLPDCTITRYYQRPWSDLTLSLSNFQPINLAILRAAFEKAVEKRLMSDVPYGVLLSGGLDSSLVASVAVRLNKKARLHSFSIGLKGSPDHLAARKVADFLNTKHYEFTFDIQDGIDALSDVIYYLETFDCTTIRASTPMYLMSRKIKAMGVKMVLSGEGSDEIFGGYLYFHKAPSPDEFWKETCRKINTLHMFDCLRANKSSSAWGLEVRVPFLDLEFLEIAMHIDPNEKMITANRMEKWILRKAFDISSNPYLPDSILWRQKEQFSDGVGYNWIDSIKAYAETIVTDIMMLGARYRFPIKTPRNKEEYLYRSIFVTHFPHPDAIASVPFEASVACSSAVALKWDAFWTEDPSGRIIGIHDSAHRIDNIKKEKRNKK